MSKPIELRPEDWKHLVLLNLAQLQNYIGARPAMLEGGSSGVTPEDRTLFDYEVERLRMLMRGWERSRFDVPLVGDAPAAEPVAAAQNGAHETKRKGGWPKGKKRQKPQAEAPQ